MYPRTLQTQIMRHMLNLAKDMASGDLLESRKKLEEYPLRGDPSVFDHIMRARAVQDRIRAMRMAEFSQLSACVTLLLRSGRRKTDRNRPGVRLVFPIVCRNGQVRHFRDSALPA
jgi:hypothetical protein